MTDRQIVEPARTLAGELRVPGDKSISHRALLIAGVGEGECQIVGLSDSLDVAASRSALASLGVVVSGGYNPQVESAELSTRGLDWEILVKGRGFAGLEPPDAPLDCRNSGTTARTILGILAGRDFTTSLRGDKSLSRRPMLRVVEPLRAMGAIIEGNDRGGRLPLTISGGSLTGIRHASPVASAQIKTCLIFAGLQASGETVIEEPAPSRDHTERMLRYLGVPIEASPDRVVVKSTNIRSASSLKVPGDLSSAAFLLVAGAIVPGSTVSVTDVGLNETRSGILDVLRRFGARVDITDERAVCGEPWGTVTVQAGDRKPVSVSGPDIARTVDELPLVAVLGAFAEGDTVIADAAELRVKESDRIATTAAAIRALGGAVETTPDGMVVKGTGTLAGGTVESAGDHRIAMAFAVAGLAATGPVEVRGWDAVAVSYPGFLSDLQDLIER